MYIQNKISPYQYSYILQVGLLLQRVSDTTLRGRQRETNGFFPWEMCTTSTFIKLQPYRYEHNEHKSTVPFKEYVYLHARKTCLVGDILFMLLCIAGWMQKKSLPLYHDNDNVELQQTAVLKNT